MKIILAVFALFFSTLVSATTLNNIVVFGDSLSDNGNLYEYMSHLLPVSPPYHEGRFTNGPVWIERIASHYYPNDSNAHLQDYAFGGASVLEEYDPNDALFTLSREVDSYLLAHQDKADENSLYVVWIGSNNYLSISDVNKPEDVQKIVTSVVTGITYDMKRLVDKGAKHILVVNLPDFGRIPAARDLDAVATLTLCSEQHNELLKKSISDLQKNYPDVQWIYFDVFASFNDLLQFPEQHGFTNITDTCYEALMDEHSPNPVLKMVSMIKARANTDACTGYLFFDPVHPSAPAHEILKDKTIELFNALGIEFGP